MLFWIILIAVVVFAVWFFEPKFSTETNGSKYFTYKLNGTVNKVKL